MIVAGVDGCPRGWAAVLVDADGFVDARVFPDAARLVSGLPEPAAICVERPQRAAPAARPGGDRAAARPREREDVPAADLLDAAAAAWSARRLVRGDYLVLPPDPADGEPRIVF